MWELVNKRTKKISYLSDEQYQKLIKLGFQNRFTARQSVSVRVAPPKNVTIQKANDRKGTKTIK